MDHKAKTWGKYEKLRYRIEARLEKAFGATERGYICFLWASQTL
jgi:hypothetical protein